MADDEFMPALSMESPKVTAPLAGGGGDDASVPQPDSTTAVRDQRVTSDKTRALFRSAVEQIRKHDAVDDDLGVAITTAPTPPIPDDLEPMEHGAAPAQTRQTAPAAPRAPAPVEPEAPSIPPTSVAAAAEIMAKAEAARQNAAHEARMKALEERERQFEEREKARAKALEEREKALPGRTDLVERPAAAMAALIKEHYGTATDDELKDVISDFVTELSEAYLGIKLPQDVKSGVESRKALRSVRAYKEDIGRREAASKAELEAKAAEIEAKQAAVVQAERERKAIDQVNQLVHMEESKAAYPHLHALRTLGITDNPSGIVVEIIRQQLASGQPADWKAAAKLADDHYKDRVIAAVKGADQLRPRFLNAPPAPAAAQPKPAVPQVQGDQVPRQRTLTAAPTAPAPDPSSDEQAVEDRYERRHSALRSRYQAHRARLQQQ